MDLNKLKNFYEVALTGTYLSAGDKLGKTSSAMGTSVRDLEKELGCTLFRRTYRGLSLTSEGQRLFESATKIMQESQLVETELRSKEDKLKHLHILAAVGITSDWVARFVPPFLKKHPSVHLEISSLTKLAAFDLYQYEIYIGEIFKKDPKYIYKHVKNFQYNFYASPEYIQENGHPRTAADLKNNHRLIEFNIRRFLGSYKSTDFFETLSHERIKKISIDSLMGEYKLATAGVGIACLCNELSFLKDSNLIPVLEDVGPMEVEIYFVFHESLRGNKLVESLLNEVRAHA